MMQNQTTRLHVPSLQIYTCTKINTALGSHGAWLMAHSVLLLGKPADCLVACHPNCLVLFFRVFPHSVGNKTRGVCPGARGSGQ